MNSLPQNTYVQSRIAAVALSEEHHMRPPSLFEQLFFFFFFPLALPSVNPLCSGVTNQAAHTHRRALHLLSSPHGPGQNRFLPGRIRGLILPL